MLSTQIEPVLYASQTPDGGWRVAGSRVSLDSIIHAHREGRTPEQIVESFPTLSLEQVHGAIAFYLRHRDMLDMYLKEQQQRWEQVRQESEVHNRELLQRLRAHRDSAGANVGGASS